MEFRKMVTITLYARQKKETQMYRTDFWTLWEKVRVGWSERTASKHVYYQLWNRSPIQVGCMSQVLGAGALGWPRGMGWGGRWEGGSGWGTHVNPWLIHVNVWQKPLQYCKVISLQLIKIKEKNVENKLVNITKKKESLFQHHSSKASILQCSAICIVQLSHPYMNIGKTTALTRWTFVSKVMSLLFKMLSRLVIQMVKLG